MAKLIALLKIYNIFLSSKLVEDSWSKITLSHLDYYVWQQWIIEREAEGIL
jgi:hypothetical protein